MQKYKDSWPEIRSKLNEELACYKGNVSELCEATGLSYWAINRALSKGVCNYTSRAEELCKALGVEANTTAKSQGMSLHYLNGLLAEIWDGSEGHGMLIADLIKSTDRFRVQKKGAKVVRSHTTSKSAG